MLLRCEEECAFKNSHSHFSFTAWQGFSYAKGKGKHSTPLNEYGYYFSITLMVIT